MSTTYYTVLISTNKDYTPGPVTLCHLLFSSLEGARAWAQGHSDMTRGSGHEVPLQWTYNIGYTEMFGPNRTRYEVTEMSIR